MTAQLGVLLPPSAYCAPASWLQLFRSSPTIRASQEVLVVKNPPTNARYIRDAGSIPGSERSPGRGHGNPVQYSCLENPMDRGAWWTTVHKILKSQTLLSDRAHTHNIYNSETSLRTENWSVLNRYEEVRNMKKSHLLKMNMPKRLMSKNLNLSPQTTFIQSSTDFHQSDKGIKQNMTKRKWNSLFCSKEIKSKQY